MKQEYKTSKMSAMKAVFLDRDGTINKDEVGYISHPDDFNLFPDAAKAIAMLNKAGYMVFVVTNQSGIARGYYTFDDLDIIHNRMHELLSKEDAHVDEVFISPYHHEGTIEPWNIRHEDRKPGLGMFRKAQDKYDVSVRESFMIGDKYSDVAFGKKAGMKMILVETGYGREVFLRDREKWEFKPDYMAKDLLAAAKLILWMEDNQ